MSVLQKNNSLPFPPSFHYLVHFRTVEVKGRQLSSVPSLIPLSHTQSWKDFYIYHTAHFPLTKPINNLCKEKNRSELSESSRMSLWWKRFNWLHFYVMDSFSSNPNLLIKPNLNLIQQRKSFLPLKERGSTRNMQKPLQTTTNNSSKVLESI